MIEWLKNFYTSEDVNDEIRIVNVIHSVCTVVMIAACVLSYVFIEDSRGIYLSFGMGILFLLTMIEANRIGKAKGPILAVVIAYNFVYMPSMYFMFDEYICVMPLYFLFGIIYTVLLMDVNSAVIWGSIETVFYFLLLIFGYNIMSADAVNMTREVLDRRYYSAVVAVVVSGICAGAAVRFKFLYFVKITNDLDAKRLEAMDAYAAKDIFLINMSHEIRTPMNAIVGNVNLLLENDISEKVSDGVYSILNSCNALLSITDELMDLSKAESGEISLYISPYDLSELLMEIVNMLTVRLTESNLDFYVDINKDIPRQLYGDSSKIRQLFVNLLNNSVKFTQKGKIVLRVDYCELDEDNIELIVDVEDTGSGIDQDKIGHIFDNPNARGDRTDSYNDEMNKIYETGLGLSVCREIVNRMNGSISAASELGKGSVFTFKVPQKLKNQEKIIKIDNPGDYYVLVFEKDEEHLKHVKRIFDELSIKADAAKNRQEFERYMSVNPYTHIFIDNNRYEECEGFLNTSLVQAKIIAFVETNDSVRITKATTVLNRPINVISIGSLITNQSNSYVREVLRSGSFVCPRATVLVVDDNYTNLNVATSILKKYEINVLNAASGKDCLRIVKENNVDLVFLDYMMPEMNGIDTLEALRKIPGSKFSALPVIALTANVVSGAREMFLASGFDDFLAKPIAIDKLERMLRKYLPKDFIEYKASQD